MRRGDVGQGLHASAAEVHGMEPAIVQARSGRGAKGLEAGRVVEAGEVAHFGAREGELQPVELSDRLGRELRFAEGGSLHSRIYTAPPRSAKSVGPPMPKVTPQSALIPASLKSQA